MGVYRCDDDNLVHPNFFKGLTELTKQDAKMYIVAQDCDDERQYLRTRPFDSLNYPKYALFSFKLLKL